MKKSSITKGDCGISSSESTFFLSINHRNPFFYLGMVVNPFQSIPGYIGSGIPETKDFFWKFWITRTDFKRRKWSQRTANNRSFLSLEIPKCPEILIHEKRILKIKLFWSLTDIGIGVCVKTQNRVRGKKV